MKEQQLKELLLYMENKEAIAYQKDQPSLCGSIIEDIPYQHDLDCFHTLDILYPLNYKKSYPFIFYLHGGGFCMHSKDHLYRNHATRLVQDEFAVVNVNYRLAPAAPFEHILEDVLQAIRFISQHAEEYQLDSHHMILCGDSAGGYLAMKSACILHQNEYPFCSDITCCAVASLCGILDLAGLKYDPDIRFPLKQEIIHMLFSDDVIPQSAAIYPYLQASFPPVFLMDTAYHSFAKQAETCHQFLCQNHIKHTLQIFPKEEKLSHNFQILQKYEQTQLVIQDMLAFFHSCL